MGLSRFEIKDDKKTSAMTHPKKSLGQNFLTDPNYKKKIINAVSVGKDDEIMEIGAGKGVLSEEIAGRCRKFVVVEKDEKLAFLLKEKFKSTNGVKVIPADFLDLDLSFLGEKTRVVGNLPYSVASQIFIKLMENHAHFSDLFLMFQKEMGMRFTARPATRDYGLPTLWALIYTDCRVLFDIPPTAFFPIPKVRSSFLHFKIKDKPLLEDSKTEAFFSTIRFLFQNRRKTLRAALKKMPGMDAKKTESIVRGFTRAEELSVCELIALSRKIAGIRS